VREEKRREQDGWAEVGKTLAEFFKFLDWTKTNWLGTALEYDKPGAWNGVWPKQRQITVLYNEPGGVLPDHVRRWQDLAASGDAVEIRGDCMSACTLIMAYVPSERICFGESASLQFHPVRARETGDLLANETARMVNSYPLDIHEWIKAKGGVSKMAVGQMWVLDAPMLWKMGYQKCAPEPAPVPMTIRPSALQHYRPNWETAEDAEIREREEWRKRDETAAQRYRESVRIRTAVRPE